MFSWLSPFRSALPATRGIYHLDLPGDAPFLAVDQGERDPVAARGQSALPGHGEDARLAGSEVLFGSAVLPGERERGPGRQAEAAPTTRAAMTSGSIMHREPSRIRAALA